MQKKRFGRKNALKIIAGSDFYVNLEPCSIEKNTPPCSNTLIEYKIKSLFCGTLDPNPEINGRGIKLLEKAGIKTKVGLLSKECKELNKIFFTNQKNHVPTLFLKVHNQLMEKLLLKMEKVAGFQILNLEKIVTIFVQKLKGSLSEERRLKKIIHHLQFD